MIKINKKGITLIALIVTIIVLLILASVSIIVVTEGNIIEKARETRRDDKIKESKSLVQSVLNQQIRLKEYNNVSFLASDIENELKTMKGLEETKLTINSDGSDYIVSMSDNISFTIEDATGRKLPMYIDNYLTRNELESR